MSNGGGDQILKHLVDDAIGCVADKGAQASDREVILACFGLLIRNMSEKIDWLRWPLWFAGGTIAASAGVQVLMKLIWGV